MTSTALAVTPTPFENILVTAIPSVDPSTGKVTYKTTFSPEILKVTQPDTVVNYQLVSPTPVGVKFKSVKVKQKTDQLSIPSISLSGKLVTMSDANTTHELISLTFHFSDDSGIEFSVDPDILNDPEPIPPMR